MNEIITEKLAYSKAFLFVMEHYLEVLKAGFSELSLCINNEMNVTYMINNGEVVSACVYDMDTNKGQAWIYIAATAKHRRGEGLYDYVYEEVENVCRANAIKVLNSNIHTHNTAMIEHAIRHERELLWFRSRKYL
jgi:hypothetical protein